MTATTIPPATRPTSDDHDPAPAAGLTWAAIAELEPRLLGLRAAARLTRRRHRTWHEYQRLRGLLSRLVGWHASRPELRSTEAYDLAHRHVLGGW